MANKTLSVKVLHVCKSTAEWAAESTLISKGLLCIEFTTDGKCLAKVGDGATAYSGLPYLSDGSFVISDYYTKTEADAKIDEKISELGDVLRVKGVKSAVSELPSEGNEVGDVWFVGTAGATTDNFGEYVWTTAGTWEFLGRVQTEVDLSGYAEVTYVDAEVKKVADRTTTLETTVGTHTADTDIHITAAERTKWDTVVTDLGTHTADTDIHITAAERTKWDGAVTALDSKVDKEDGKGLSSNDLTDELLQEINDALDKLGDVEEGANKTVVDTALSADSTNPVENKAVKAAIDTLEKSISESSHSHDNKTTLDAIEEAYTTAEKTKLAGIDEGANKTVVDAALSATSSNPVENKAVYTAIDGKVDKEEGKGLSSNDFTDEDKAAIETLTTNVGDLTDRVKAIEDDYLTSADTLVLNCTL